jgi:hypothetical protein
VTDSTLESNSATPNAAFPSTAGGGIYNTPNGTLTVTSSTLSSNSASSGGGIFSFSAGTLSLHNTIVAGNRSSPDSGPDINGRAQSGSSYNLVGIADSTLTGISDGSQGNQIGTLDSPIDPLLGPLQDNGGPTQTMAVLPGSPARAAGDPTDAPEWDQRGPGFPRVVNGAMDIGAYQVQEGEASPRTTAYATETGLASLQAIMAYWSSTTDDYATRVGNLLSGNAVPLLDATMVTNNGGGNTLMGNHSGAAEMNLFYGLDPTLETTDYNPAIGEQFINC